MAKQIYTDGETAKYRAKRRDEFKKAKVALKNRGRRIQLVYSDDATNQQRGFTPVGSSVLNFPVLNRMRPSEQLSFNPKNNSIGVAKRTQRILNPKTGKVKIIIHSLIPADKGQPAFNQFKRFKNR